MARKNTQIQITTEEQNLINKLFDDYKIFICKIFIDKFGGNYRIAKNWVDTWRYSFDFSQKSYDELVFQTCVFLKDLPEKTNIYKKPYMVKTLAEKICEYLSEYTWKIYDQQNTSEDQKKALKHQQFKQLMHSVFHTHGALIRCIARHNVKQQQEDTKEKTKPQETRKRKRICDCYVQPKKQKKRKKQFLTPQEEAEAQKKMEKIHQKIMHERNLTIMVSIENGR